MRTTAAAALFVLVSGAAAARAQETPAPAPTPAVAEDEARDQDPAARRPIQVLHNPYEISSFYRSSQGAGAMDFDYEPSMTTGERYPIAGFYRSGGARGRYSMFWTTGYGDRRGRIGGRGLLGARRPRALGLNGDLCLFAPTFLAPVGPLTGVFFER